MYCTAQEVRDTNDKIRLTADISDAVIEGRITLADKMVVSDLSRIYTEAELDAMTSTTLNLLSLYKSAELTLVKLFGAKRQADEVSDIQYWQTKYDRLLADVLSRKVLLDDAPINYPVVTPTARIKIFPRKGLPGIEEGYEDDPS
jgi:hypothetical protein